MSLNICDMCQEELIVKRCSGCSTAFYCSSECQKLDWKTHKIICKYWRTDHNTISNPWYCRKSPIEPEIYKDNTRGRYGETIIHEAIYNSNIEELMNIINEKRCNVGSEDYYGNTPLYYLCTNPGPEENPINIEDRLEMTKILLDFGANPWTKGGFTGERCFDQALSLGYEKVTKLILKHRITHYVEIFRELYNKKDIDNDLVIMVRLWTDIEWRIMTIDWLCHVSRDLNRQCLNPHPKILDMFNSDDLSISNIHRNIQYRYLLLNYYIDQYEADE